MPLFSFIQDERILLRVFDRWAAGRLPLRGAGRWILLDEIALLGDALEDVVGGIACQRLNTHQFPTIFAQRIHIAARKGASALVIRAKSLQTFAGNAPPVIDIRNFICPSCHRFLLSLASSPSHQDYAHCSKIRPRERMMDLVLWLSGSTCIARIAISNDN